MFIPLAAEVLLSVPVYLGREVQGCKAYPREASLSICTAFRVPWDMECLWMPHFHFTLSAKYFFFPTGLGTLGWIKTMEGSEGPLMHRQPWQKGLDNTIRRACLLQTQHTGMTTPRTKVEKTVVLKSEFWHKGSDSTKSAHWQQPPFQKHPITYFNRKSWRTVVKVCI